MRSVLKSKAGFLNISCLVITFKSLVSVHAGEGKFCSQSHFWEMCPCLLLPPTAKRLHVSDRMNHLFTSLAQQKWKVKTQQILYLVNGSGAPPLHIYGKGTNSEGWVLRWSFCFRQYEFYSFITDMSTRFQWLVFTLIRVSLMRRC